ncbi:MAG: 50S ribosomal protein L10 [Candidatus Eiseniibacteriota bacterium]
MPTAEKEAQVQEMTERLSGVKGMYLADFSGMTVEKVSALRAKCRASGVQYKVIKNTLLKRAVNAKGVTQLDDFLEGPTALAYSLESEVEPARVLVEFAKENEKPLIKAGLIGDKLYNAAEVKQLASLPPRDVLLAQVLGTLCAPLSGFLGSIDALVASPARLAGALESKQGS